MILYNIKEEYKNDIIEHIVAGNFSTRADYSTGDQKAQSVSDLTQSNQTTIQSSQTIDNSLETTNTTQNNTAINSSQNITQTNDTDQSSVMNITSSTDTYNYDQSSILNNTTSNTQNKLIQTCGASIEEAESIINIVKDNSINSNINNGNVFINTGDDTAISSVRIKSELTFLSSSVDQNCVLDAINELQSELNTENVNSKTFSGGEGGDVGAEAGGNSSTSDNSISKEDSLDAGMTTDNANTQKSATTAGTTNDVSTTSEASASQSQSQEQSQGGGVTDIIFIILFLFIFLFLYLK